MTQRYWLLVIQTWDKFLEFHRIQFSQYGFSRNAYNIFTWGDFVCVPLCASCSEKSILFIRPWQNLHLFRCRCACFALSNPHLQADYFCYKIHCIINFYSCLWTSITFLLSHLFSSLRSPGLLSNFLHGSTHSWIVSKWDTVAVFNSNLSAIC